MKSAHVVEAYPTRLGIGGEDRCDSLLSGQALMKRGINVRIGAPSQAGFHKATHHARKRMGHAVFRFQRQRQLLPRRARQDGRSSAGQSCLGSKRLSSAPSVPITST